MIPDCHGAMVEQNREDLSRHKNEMLLWTGESPLDGVEHTTLDECPEEVHSCGKLDVLPHDTELL